MQLTYSHMYSTLAIGKISGGKLASDRFSGGIVAVDRFSGGTLAVDRLSGTLAHGTESQVAHLQLTDLPDGIH
jgi:hypothetical protein